MALQLNLCHRTVFEVELHPMVLINSYGLHFLTPEGFAELHMGNPSLGECCNKGRHDLILSESRGKTFLGIAIQMIAVPDIIPLS